MLNVDLRPLVAGIRQDGIEQVPFLSEAPRHVSRVFAVPEADEPDAADITDRRRSENAVEGGLEIVVARDGDPRHARFPRSAV